MLNIWGGSQEDKINFSNHELECEVYWFMKINIKTVNLIDLVS